MKTPAGAGAISSFNFRGTCGQQGQGPFFDFQFLVVEDVVTEAAFVTYGCPWATAIGSVVVSFAIGKEIKCLRSISINHIVQELETIPRDKQDLVGIAIAAVGRIGEVGGK